MAAKLENAALGEIGTLFAVGTIGGLSDGQLIEQFLSGPPDLAEAAFAALVDRRWLEMVIRVYRRYLPTPTMPTTLSRPRSWCSSGGRAQSHGVSFWRTGFMGSLTGRHEWHGLAPP